MATLRDLFGVELSKLIRRPMTWISAVVLLGFVVLVYAALLLTLLAGGTEGNLQVQGADSTQSLREQILMPDGFSLGLNLAQGVGGVLLVIIAAGMFGSEISWGTLRTMLLMRADRTRLVIAKLLVLGVGAIVVTIIGVVVGLAGSLFVGLVLGEGLRTSSWVTGDFFQSALVAAGTALVGLAMWALVGATMTVLTRSLAAGIGITLALLFVGDLVLQLVASAGRVGVWISRLFLNTALSALSRLASNNPPHYNATDWAWIITNLVVYAVVLVAVAVVRFRRMNALSTT